MNYWHVPDVGWESARIQFPRETQRNRQFEFNMLETVHKLRPAEK